MSVLGKEIYSLTLLVNIVWEIVAQCLLQTLELGQNIGNH